MSTIRKSVQEKPWLGWALFIITALIVFGLGLLTSSIVERRTEAQFVDQKKVDIQEFEPRNIVWGQNYPRQYETYMSTRDTSFLSKYNGNAHVDQLEQFPALVILWAGYGFAKDYNQAKGHVYAVTDIYVCTGQTDLHHLTSKICRGMPMILVVRGHITARRVIKGTQDG